MELIQRGNSKLAEAGIMMFNLPATKQVCGRVCKNCYSIKEQVRYSNVLPAREARYEAAKLQDFADSIQAELDKKRKKPKIFRVHASGEFFSQDYVNDWVTIAKSNPEIIFYAYTKRKSSFDFSELEQLDNFILIDSFHWGRKNYGTIARAPVGAFICPEQKGASIRCGIDCTYCMTKKAQEEAPYFIEH